MSYSPPYAGIMTLSPRRTMEATMFGRPSLPPPSWFPLGIALLLPALASADVVHVSGGAAYAGAPTFHEDGSVSLRTLTGTVEIPADELREIEKGAALRRTLKTSRKKFGPNDAAGAAELCKWAIDKGLFAEAVELADQALGAVARGRAAGPVALPPTVLSLPVADVYRDSVLDKESTRRLLLASGGKKLGRSMIAKARLKELATRQDLSAPMMKALGDISAEVRRTALQVLAITTPDEALERVLRAMLFDKDVTVRKQATETAIAFAEDGIVYPISRALEQDDPALREAGLDAAEILNDPHVVGALVRMLRRADSAGKSRAHSANITHTSYVKDFDVEIAQAAVIAQPIVGVLQHGTVHDVGVAGVFERRVSRGQLDRASNLLSRLTGQKFGTNWRRWDAWLAQQQ